MKGVKALHKLSRRPASQQEQESGDGSSAAVRAASAGSRAGRSVQDALSEAERERVFDRQHSLGISILFDPTEHVAVADIVFIHGVTGNAYTTWLHKSSGIHWPLDLLKNDVPNARILAFGYDADIVNLWSPVSSNRIGDHAENFLGDLARLRGRTDTEHRTLIIVAHSLGGLLAENALCLSKSSAERHIRTVESSVSGVIFLGTPQHGSDLAAWGQLGATLTKVVRRPNKDIIAVLRPGSDMLANVQRDFHNLLRNRIDEGQQINLTSFYEELAVPLAGEIVPKHSAIIPGYASYGIHADHMGMARFSSPSDRGYDAILGELRRWIKRSRAELSDHQRECLNLFDFEDRDVREENISPSLKDTFTWIWSDPNLGYVEWMETGNMMYWIRGKPASGKSTFMRYLVWSTGDQISSGAFGLGHTIILSYFLDFQASRLARSIEGMLRSLIYQLLSSRQVFSAMVYEKIKYMIKSRQVSKWRVQDLQLILSERLEESRNLRILLFIDALDEYEGADEKIAEYLEQLASSCGPRLRIVASSRPHADFLFQFIKCPGFRLEDMTASDIYKYVHHRFEKAIQNRQEYELLPENVIQRADGVFLWARLVCDDLLRGCVRGETASKLATQLDRMPDELPALYKRIIDTLDVSDREEASHMLAIVNSATRPLSLFEFSKALALSLPDSLETFVSSHRNLDDFKSDTNDIGRIVARVYAICKGLLDCRYSPGIDNSHQIVAFTHETVHGFLRAGPGLSMPQGDAILLRACLQYVNFFAAHCTEKWPTSNHQSTMILMKDILIRRFEFSQYAIVNWRIHAKRAEIATGKSQTEELRLFTKSTYLIWRDLYYRVFEQHEHFDISNIGSKSMEEIIAPPIPDTLVGAAILFHLNLYFSDMVSSSPSVLDMNLDNGQLVLTAVQGNNLLAAKMLLDRVHSISPTQTYAFGATSWAIFAGSIPMTELLLSKGSNPNTTGLRSHELITNSEGYDLVPTGRKEFFCDQRLVMGKLENCLESLFSRPRDRNFDMRIIKLIASSGFDFSGFTPENKANPYIFADDDWTLFYNARARAAHVRQSIISDAEYRDWIELWRIILQRCKDDNARRPFRESKKALIQIARKFASKDLVIMLLDAGPDPNLILSTELE